VQGGFASAELMAQMTGICQQNFLNRLSLVDLSFSNQGNGLRRLGSHQLSALKKVQALYLHESGIEVIDVDAFEPVSDSIGLLNLADNQLEILRNGTFDMITQRGTKIDLFLAGMKSESISFIKFICVSTQTYKDFSPLIIKAKLI
jgi:hypothetical protein